MIFPGQWPGSLRRVWTFDPNQQVAYFKMYDECGASKKSGRMLGSKASGPLRGADDDCSEDEAIVYLEMPWDGQSIWNPDTEMYWDVAVEPIEPEMTQMIWVPTPVD